MKRCGCGGGGSISSPLVAAAMLFLLLLLLAGSFHCAAAARLLPSSPSVVPAAPQLVHQENGAETADGLALQESGANGDELSSVSEMMGAETAEEEEGEVSCEEGNDECLQRRLLRDAHLDYIYTQHKGKP